MNFEYLYLEPISISTICLLDISNLDRLFLKVTILNGYIRLHMDCLKLLQKMDKSKTILVAESEPEFATKFQRWIPVHKWTGLIIQEDSNYLYKDYNFINLIQIKKFIRHSDKTNIGLHRLYKKYKPINDELRLLNSEIYVDLLIAARSIEYDRYIKCAEGIVESRAQNYRVTNFQYLQLIDKKLYIKPAAIYSN